MSKNEEKKQIYEILILRVDGEHISVMQTDNFDSCYETWEKLTNNWETCVSEKKPFRLKEPVITSFDPGLIKEIAIRPIAKVEESKYANPYQQQMMKQGLTSMLQNQQQTFGSQLLDEGYTP